VLMSPPNHGIGLQAVTPGVAAILLDSQHPLPGYYS
jgi:hypothetical protein